MRSSVPLAGREPVCSGHVPESLVMSQELAGGGGTPGRNPRDLPRFVIGSEDEDHHTGPMEDSMKNEVFREDHDVEDDDDDDDDSVRVEI